VRVINHLYVCMYVCMYDELYHWSEFCHVLFGRADCFA